MGIEKCPHCDTTVMFSGDICPSCKSDKKATVNEDDKAKRIGEKRQRHLSSKLTLYYKFAIPVVMFFWLIILVKDFVFGDTSFDMFINSSKGIEALIVMLVITISYLFLLRKIQLVKFDDKFLFIASFFRYNKIPLSEITAINKLKLPWILSSELYAISLKEETESLSRIIFIRKNDGSLENTSSAIGSLVKNLGQASINI
jgi:signal transduction histidine kinase